MLRSILVTMIGTLLAGDVDAQSPGPFGFGLTSCQHDGDTYTANREELVRVFFQENGVSVVNAVDQLYPDAEELRERFSAHRG